MTTFDIAFLVAYLIIVWNGEYEYFINYALCFILLFHTLQYFAL